MAKAKAKQVIPLRSREEEREILAVQAEKIRTNPAYGLELARRAGIVDKNGKLTAHYKREG